MRITNFWLTFVSPCSVKFRSDTNDKTGAIVGTTNTVFVAPYNPMGWFETDAGAALNVDLSIGALVTGQITYTKL